MEQYTHMPNYIVMKFLNTGGKEKFPKEEKIYFIQQIKKADL